MINQELKKDEQTGMVSWASRLSFGVVQIYTYPPCPKVKVDIFFLPG